MNQSTSPQDELRLSLNDLGLSPTYCPRCNTLMQPAIALNNGPSKWWLECSNPKCNTFYNTYAPQEHQAAFHEDAHRFTGNFGG